MRILIAAMLTALLLATTLVGSSSGDLQGQIAVTRSAADTLKQQIAADSAQIAGTANGVATAQRRLSSIQATLNRRVTELKGVQTSLLVARNHLVDLENHLQAATTALAHNLVAGYEGAKPDVMTVILNSHGFSELLNQMTFLQRIAHQDSHVVGATRTARAEVSRQAARLETLEQRDRALAEQILTQRNSAAALQSALLGQEAAQEARRARVSASLHSVNAHLGALRARLAAIQRRAAEETARAAAQATRAEVTGNVNVGGIAVNTGGMVQPPAGAPEAVRQVIAAGNAIATLPYVWGGGHGSFHADGYDCSGSVSYALAAAGLLSSPLTSGAFESWGEPGPGKWITVYANAGHAWMEVAGWRFDTVALSESGTRWSQGGGEYSGFVARHPAGL